MLSIEINLFSAWQMIAGIEKGKGWATAYAFFGPVKIELFIFKG